MGKVTEHLANLIKSRMKDKGIIVWYDPGQQYEKHLSSFDLTEIPLFRFEGSFFKLRKTIDEYLDGEEPKTCLVYIPLERKKGSSPMIEAESAGQILEPGGAPGTNTRLDIIARQVLTDLLPSENVDEICRSVAQGSLMLEDLDKIAEAGASSGKGVVSLIFGTASPQEVALKFLSSDTCDLPLKEKRGLSELLVICKSAYGFDSGKSEIEAVKKELSRYILISDFLSYMKKDAIRNTFADTPQATKDAHLEACKNLAAVWRNRIDLKDSYESISKEMERDFSIENLAINPFDFIECDTFHCLEQALFQYACQLILADKYLSVEAMIERRIRSFWALLDPVGLLRWSLLKSAVDLMKKAADIRKELESTPLSHSEIIRKYVHDQEDERGWYALDYYHRLLEKQYATYDEGLSENTDDLIMQTMAKARHHYTDVVGIMNTMFFNKLMENKFNFEGMPRQTAIFNTYVEGKVSSGKIAYILVDALRYEMGKELFDSITEFTDKDLQFAIASPPTVTEFGMASLLPGAEKGLEIGKGGPHKIVPRIHDIELKNRENRIELLKKYMTIKVKDVKLEQVIKPGRKIKEEIQGSDFIVVTSREIDEICEGDNIILARKIMNDILGEVGRAIRNLSRLGVERFVITGDHGYLFGEELTEAMKVDPPGGNTLCVHRRFWAGYGGNADDYYFRVSSLQLGLTGDLEFAFPKGMAGFKAKGGARAYFHGGMSLQELIIPVITIHASGGQKPPSGQNIFEIQADRKKITSPFFTVKVRYRWSGLFGEEMCRVQMVVKSGRAVAGRVATAVYGHEPGTSEVTLKVGEKNFVTLMLDEDCRDKQVVVSVLDRETGRELARSDKLEVSLIS